VRFGVQVSIARGTAKAVEFAVERGCEAVQLFSSNPRGWALSPATDDAAIRTAFADAGIHPIVLHTPYLINIAAHDPTVYARSIASLVHAAHRARRMDAFVVVHAGRDQTGPRSETLTRAAGALLTAVKLVPRAHILIEPTAGGRGSVASTVGELAELLEAVNDDAVGVCLDTCHVHACGHDLSTRPKAKSWLREIGKHIGFDRVRVLHVNDARDPPGSCRDRHWGLGDGTIGEEGFRAVLSDKRLRGATAILETPGNAQDDKRNLERARSFYSGKADD
jgi:deoxyribonuclease-4